jgi:hypothetical protein
MTQTSSSTTCLDVCAFAYVFTGKERDNESGLDYFGARYYAGVFSGTSMIGNSQGEAEIPLDCYLSWTSPKSPPLLYSSRSGVTCHPTPDAVGSVAFRLGVVGLPEMTTDATCGGSRV